MTNNIALNKPVIGLDEEGRISPQTPLSVVTDGVFLPEATTYSSQAAVDGSLRFSTTSNGLYEIDLGGLYRIDGVIVQSDNNDRIELYSSQRGSPFYVAQTIIGGPGFLTRPGPDQATYAAITPVVTNVVYFNGAGGDYNFGVSEIQLRGVSVPEPTALLTFAATILGRRRHRR